MFGLIILSVGCWMYLAWRNSNARFMVNIPYAIRGGGGGNDSPPAVPTYDQSFPSWAKDLPPEQIALLRQYASGQTTTPSAFGQAQDIYGKLANYSPDQFKYPMEDIQKALQAQQDIQYQQYQKQINPILASQGQYDSSYRTNLNSDFLKGQQAQAYGQTANLLTNQASQNFDLSKMLPQWQGAAASGLTGLGAQQANVNNQNAQRPLLASQGLGQVYQQGLSYGNNQYDSAMKQYQAALDQYNQQQEQQQGLYSSLGMISPIGGAIYGGVSGGGQGLASSLSGTFDAAKLAAQLYGSSASVPSFGGGSTGQGAINPNAFNSSSLYNPSWGQTPSYMNGGYSF